MKTSLRIIIDNMLGKYSTSEANVAKARWQEIQELRALAKIDYLSGPNADGKLISTRIVPSRDDIISDIVTALAMPTPITESLGIDYRYGLITEYDWQYKKRWLRRRFEWFARTSPTVIGDLLDIYDIPISIDVEQQFCEGYDYESFDPDLWAYTIVDLLRDWIVFSPSEVATEYERYVDVARYRTRILWTLSPRATEEFLPLLHGLVNRTKTLDDASILSLISAVASLKYSQADDMLADLDRHVRGNNTRVDEYLDRAIELRKTSRNA